MSCDCNSNPRTSVLRVISVTAGVPMLIFGPSPKRAGLLFTGASAGNYVVGTDSRLGADGGLLVSTSGGAVELTLGRHGDIVRQGWYVRASQDCSFAVLETILLG